MQETTEMRLSVLLIASSLILLMGWGIHTLRRCTTERQGPHVVTPFDVDDPDAYGRGYRDRRE